MFISRYRFLAGVFVAVMLLPALRGQTVTGTISGVVVDPGGKSIPAASITVTNDANQVARTAVTDNSGAFSFPALEPATYTITVEKTGFQMFRAQGQTLTASQRLALGEIKLTIGSVSETVTITDQAALLQSDSSENSAVLTDRQMEMIAARGRDVTDLLRLLPGVSQTQSVEALGGAGGPPGTAAPNISGARAGAIDFTVDGVAGNDMGTMSALSSAINMDAIGEVTVLLTNFQAEYGRNNGAIVSVVTKSGTSQFHGTGYWYKRHEMFNATDFFVNKSGLPKTLYRFTTLGGAIGGPVYIPRLLTNRNKLFFFYSYENGQSRFPAQFQNFTMPTAAERIGDFSASTLKPVDPSTKAPFPGNVIPPSRINSSTQALIKLFPLPNINPATTNGAYNYVFQGNYDIPKLSNVFRIDAPITSKDSIYIRGNDFHSDTKAWYTGAVTNPPWPWFYQHYTFTDASLAAHYTRVISPTTVNEFQGSVRHSTEFAPPVDFNAFNSVANRAVVGYTAGQYNPSVNPYNVIPQINSLAGVPNAPTLTYDTRFINHGGDTTFDVLEGLTMTRGSHTIKAGMYLNYAREAEGRRATFGGSFDFSNNGANPNNAVNPFANLVLGNFNTYTESTNLAGIEIRTYNLDGYVQDTWKISRRLTLDYGVRLTYYTPLHDVNVHFLKGTSLAAVFNPNLYNLAAAPRQYLPAIVNGVRVGIDNVTGQTVPAAGIGAFVPNTGNIINGAERQTDPGVPDGFINQSPPRPMPRVGFAWDPFGKGKTTIRGGFGIFFQNRLDGNISGSMASTPPNQFNSVSYYGNVSTMLASSLLAPSNGFAVDASAVTPRNMNTAFGIQQDIGFKTVLDVKYVGNFGRHLYSERNLNLLPFAARFQPANIDPTTGGALPDNLLRPYPGWGNLTYLAPNVNSNYNSLQTAVNHRLSHGLTFGLAYTYSKAMDIVDTDLAIGTPTYLPISRNYDVAGFDQTHIFSLNYTYNFPVAASIRNNRALNMVLADWQISGVTTFASGTPLSPTFTVTNGADLNGGGDPQRLNLTCDPKLPHSDRTLNEFFNTACFALPAKGDIGNAPRNPIRGPGITNFDATLFRRFKIKEKNTLIFRWEAYNVFNHTQFGGSAAGVGGTAASGLNIAAQFTPAGTLVNNGFGTANSARPPRVMQGSLRFEF